MFIAAAIVSCLLAATLVVSALGKLTKLEAVMDSMAKAGVPLDKLPLLALAELACAVGLVVGLFWWPIGVAAAIGVILYFVGAITFHLRANDRHLTPAASLLLFGVAALVLRASTGGG